MINQKQQGWEEWDGYITKFETSGAKLHGVTTKIFKNPMESHLLCYIENGKIKYDQEELACKILSTAKIVWTIKIVLNPDEINVNGQDYLYRCLKLDHADAQRIAEMRNQGCSLPIILDRLIKSAEKQTQKKLLT